MNHFELPEIELNYPIGAHMITNYKGFAKMAEWLFTYAHGAIIKAKYISLLCRGSSGAIGASIFYQKIVEKYPHLEEVRINHVKKSGEHAHSTSSSGLFCHKDHEEVLYILVDDFSNTGDTLYAIYDEVGTDIGLIDYIVVKYAYREVFQRMEQRPIAKNIITKRLGH